MIGVPAAVTAVIVTAVIGVAAAVIVAAVIVTGVIRFAAAVMIRRSSEPLCAVKTQRSRCNPTVKIGKYEHKHKRLHVRNQMQSPQTHSAILHACMPTRSYTLPERDRERPILRERERERERGRDCNRSRELN